MLPFEREADGMYKKIDTVCPYCASGCVMTATVDPEKNQIIEVKGSKRGVNNEGRLCLKGLYGWDYLNDPQLLTRRILHPFIRKNGKGTPLVQVSWAEAIAYTASRLQAIIKEYGPDAVMCAGSARGPGNEAAYVTQKFMRAVIGTNNIDHCARVCHGASVAGLNQSVGEGAMSLSVPEIEDAEVIFNIGYNAPAAHPIVARRIVRAKKKGCKIICADPRLTETARIATIYLPLKGGTNMLLLNAMAYVIITENLVDHDFIEAHTTGFDDYVKEIAQEKYAPEAVAAATHLNADDIRRAARLFASSKHSVILWGMGITQFSQGVECVIACSNLCLMTGNYGHYASGVGPVRGQNNVQGTCDMGLLPNQFPGYQPVTDDAIRHKFEQAWGVSLPKKPGISLTRVPERVLREKDPQKRLHAYYIIGEDPAQSDPDLPEMRRTLRSLDFVAVQDIFFNKTCEYADVVFPATAWGEHYGVYSSCDRRFQLVRKLIEPQKDCKTDWEILCLLATAMGYPMHYHSTLEIWDEMRHLCPKFLGATYEKMIENHGIQWPCYREDPDDTGTQYLHKGGHFAHPDGKGHFYYYPYTPVKEKESPEFPFSLSTVREVGHYSVRTMTGNCRVLADLADEPGYITMNPDDCAALDIHKGDLVRVVSRRGETVTRCLPTSRVSPGATYMTYQWWLGACNELTSSALDPKSNTPEFKYCACRVEKIADQKKAEAELKKDYQQLRAQMGIAVTKGGEAHV